MSGWLTAPLPSPPTTVLPATVVAASAPGAQHELPAWTRCGDACTPASDPAYPWSLGVSASMVCEGVNGMGLFELLGCGQLARPWPKYSGQRLATLATACL